MTNHESVQPTPTDTIVVAPSVSEGCQACRTALNSGAKFCPQCGRKLITDTQAQTQPAAPHSDPYVPGIPAEPAAAKETIQPGQESREPPASKPAEPDKPKDNKALTRCHCGQTLPSEAQFCHRCGTPTRGTRPLSRLICMDKGNFAQVAELSDKAITIGKSPDSDLVIADDDYVSRHHARIVPTGQSFLLEDLNSSNGTYLRVRGQVAVKNGDEFLIGTHLMRFEHTQGG